jgi:BirA family transcriptional regulator, biotin operon repressor / biotin---[acetyl-CoA-carboxylase] ligase
VVVGIGLNVSTEPAEFPATRPGALPATSLRAAGGTALDRSSLLLATLGELEHWYRAWQRAGGDPDRSGLRAEYTRLSATIGRTVRAELPGGQALSGPAAGVDSDGRLLVRVSPGSEVAVAAGDVVHLR